MADRYYFELARNALRIGRVVDPEPCVVHEACLGRVCDVPDPRLHGQGGGGSRALLPCAATTGRVIGEFSDRSRRNMRWELSALDWRALGARPAMVTLTYPREWREFAPDGPTCRKHVERFKSRWARRWGEPVVGVWVREFQQRGAPHFHCYLGLPGGVTADEYVELSARTQRRKRLEREMSKYEARRQAGFLTGEFGRWLLSAWSGSVRTAPGSLHARFGADVAPMFWAGSAAEFAAGDDENWRRVAEYLWRESGKFGQKTVPEDFASPGRWWGRWGVGLAVSEGELDERVYYELRRMLLGAVRARQRQWRRLRRLRGEPAGKILRVRGRDGLTAFGVGRADGARLLRLAEDLAVAKRLAAQ